MTGICLAFVYVPSANEAYTSLEYLNYQQPLGWYLRALHFWGSNFMVSIMAIHMTQVFLFGAFKYPRELTWISGCVLLLLTLGMAFTGQIMRFDQDAYWGLGIGAAIMGRVPVIGPNLVHLMLGGPIIAGETLSRFFTLHVFVIPGLLIALISLHLRLVLAKGINEYPVPGQEVKKETYAEEYEALLKKEGVPFYPKAIDKDLVFSSLVMLGILSCAAYFGPKGPRGIPNPTYIDTVPAPDFFFLWIYAALALLPPYMETFLLLTAPVVGIGLLFALPFISNTGEKSARRRPMAVLGVILVFLPLGTLTYLGTFAPWGPHMEAWTSVPTPVQYVQGRSPLELQGALLVQYKQCRNCHSLGGEGGLRGPALDGVATRLTARPVDPASDSRRRQHAGIWQESGAAGGDRPRCFHADVAPGKCTRGPRLGSSGGDVKSGMRSDGEERSIGVLRVYGAIAFKSPPSLQYSSHVHDSDQLTRNRIIAPIVDV